MRGWVLGILIAVLTVSVAPAKAAELSDAEVMRLSRAVLFGPAPEHATAVGKLVERGDTDVLPTLITAMRYRWDVEPLTVSAFRALSGSDATRWFDAMLWLQAHPEIEPHPSYRELKLELYRRIDPAFERFLGGDRALPERMKIRLEEIAWGGVRVDGIPSLDNPDLIAAGAAEYLRDDDLVFGVSINGDARAYPLRIMGWHEMFNDVIGGVPVALAYCTLCGSAILFETRVEGREQPLVFGSSGFLYRSNKLMFDRATDSLWNQFTGRPVSGPLVDSGIALKILPVATTSWERWRTANPETRVLSLETGHNRDYGSGVVYRDYFASPDLMFPALVDGNRGPVPKDRVFGIRAPGGAKAWKLSVFEGGAVVNDRVGLIDVVLLGDAATRTVRAYRREAGQVFEGTPDSPRSDGQPWTVTEEALIGPDGDRLPREPGHVAYWFAWSGYLGAETDLIQ